MNRSQNNSTRYLVAGIFVLVAVVALCVVAYRTFVGTGTAVPTAPDLASEEVVAAFYTSLAALDVEESERAARVLKHAVQLEPREPALWANLTVAHMRLRDMASARESLNTALSLADNSRELALLRAEVLEQSGEIEHAIEQLRSIHHHWPENIAATYSLFSLLGQVRTSDADAERLALLSDILSRVSGNLRARCEQARLAATLEQGEALQEALDTLLRDADVWPEAARNQLTQADDAARATDFRKAAQSLTFFENLLKPQAEYQQSLGRLGVSLGSAVGTPQRTFLRLKLPPAEAAEADVALRFELQEFPKTAARPDLVLALEQAGERRSTLMSLAGDMLQVGESAALPFPGSSIEATTSSVATADLNFDFRQDLIVVGAEGCRIFVQHENGAFVPHPVSLGEFKQAWRAVWAVDIEADGDLDLLLSDHESPLRYIRNNGDMTFEPMPAFIPADDILALQAADFDNDGDVDLATLDASGSLAVWQNERGGRYVAAATVFAESRIGLAVGDVDRDGHIDLISVLRSGQIDKATCQEDGTWSESVVVNWSPANSLVETSAGNVFLAVADIDNNGGVDVIASTDYETAVWLRGAADDWSPLVAPPDVRVASVVDVNDDGLLDLVGLNQEGGRAGLNRSQADYGWHVIQPLANTAPGDKRINAFGVGGRIEIRAGNLVQATTIQSPRVHFGLGRRQAADVARIVWPNGSIQAEFDLQAMATLEARQRLKGSCPWVFAFDGHEFRFVKDFIWRSPLGLRINAQTTAGVTQTEDWIKIPGHYLAAVDGRYQVRITAELWETHFFDQVRLVAVDHPADVEMLVDERFVPSESPQHRVRFATLRQPLHNVSDHRAQSLDETLRANDARYADGFKLGQYQGVAEEHWVAFDVPPDVSANRDVLIVGDGWVYPTDSSLNVALAQGQAPRPFGLVLEQRDASGNWQVLDDNLGFPAGKNKRVLIALPSGSLAASRHFRLRTNMEIYWDSLGWSYELTDVEAATAELPTKVAELRQRGYSKLLPLDRRRPDTPVYELEATQQRWLDLEGYYTRFGDVRELLTTVDDRYVIMNAGDELVFEFEVVGDVPNGWQRDFVLVGDGWVKDGDFNTAFSASVQPLPAHNDVEYAGPLVPLDRDPVHLRHSDDWRVYHTRYVTPRRFQRGLWPPPSLQASGEQ